MPTIDASYQLKLLVLADGPASSAAAVIWDSQTSDSVGDPMQPEYARISLALLSNISSDSNGVRGEVTYDKGLSWQLVKAATFTSSTTTIVPFEFDRTGPRHRITFTSSSGGTQTTFKGEVRGWHVRAVGDISVTTGNITVGAVTISELTPGVAATDLGKAEDAAHASGDVGVLMLARRNDTASSSSGTDGDYSTLNTNATGMLRVDASGTTAPVASKMGGVATFGGSTEAVVSTGTTGATTLSVLYLVGDGSQAVGAKLLALELSWAGGAGGDPVLLQLRRITAENGTPGGSSRTKLAASGGDTSDTHFILRAGATGAPTRAAGFFDQAVISVASPGSYLFDVRALLEGKGPTVRTSTVEGWELSVTTGTVGPTTAASMIASAKWDEA